MKDLTIEIQRNRTEKIEISIYDLEDEFISLASGEKLLFGVKKDDSQANYSIYKELTISDINSAGNAYILNLSVSDTDITSGYYYYDIAYLTGDELYPVVEYQTFKVKKNSVTMPEVET